jgi:hypothetical protein
MRQLWKALFSGQDQTEGTADNVKNSFEVEVMLEDSSDFQLTVQRLFTQMLYDDHTSVSDDLIRSYHKT